MFAQTYWIFQGCRCAHKCPGLEAGRGSRNDILHLPQGLLIVTNHFLEAVQFIATGIYINRNFIAKRNFTCRKGTSGFDWSYPEICPICIQKYILTSCNSFTMCPERYYSTKLIKVLFPEIKRIEHFMFYQITIATSPINESNYFCKFVKLDEDILIFELILA